MISKFFIDRPVFAAVLDMLATSRVIAFEGGAVRLPDHRIDLSPRDAQLWRTIESMLSGEERFRPPRGKEIADLLRAPEADVRRVLKTLTRQKVTLEIAPDHFFLRATAAEMTDIAADIESRVRGAKETIEEELLVGPGEAAEDEEDGSL